MQNNSRKFYNRIAFLYPVINLFLKGNRRALLAQVNAMPSGRLLEIGVGDGSHLRLYKSHDITAIDNSEMMFQRAQHYNTGNIHLELMNGERLTYPDASFDYVVLSHVLAVTERPELLLQQVYRVLRPGGKLFIMNHFTPRNWIGVIDRIFHPVASMLRFRSRFYLHEQHGLQQFMLLKQINFKPFSYFKLLILAKP